MRLPLGWQFQGQFPRLRPLKPVISRYSAAARWARFTVPIRHHSTAERVPLTQPLKHSGPRRLAPLFAGMRNGLPGGSETVLVVEDEASVRNPLRRMLSRQGYTVLEARDGAAALRILDQTSGQVDLVMTDLMMPGMTGRQLIPELRARLKDIKIIVMSGYDAKVAMQGGRLPAGAAFLEKPFTVQGLLQTVRLALDAKPAQASPQKGPEGG